MSAEEKQMVEKLGSCTAWDLYQEYGISKLKVSRAIKSGKLNAYMKSADGNNILIKWYIIKDDVLKEFIEKIEFLLTKEKKTRQDPTYSKSA